MSSNTMRAIQLTSPGPASNLQLVTRARPIPQPGQVLIKIKAFGLNHSELSTRLGEPTPMGNVALPRILGIECVGLVEEAPASESELRKGTVVMAALGGMGRAFDGSYAEFCVVSEAFVIPIAASEAELKLSWGVLGALPEMVQTAYGCLFRSLQVKKGERVLIRGASSSVGVMAVSLAKHAGAEVVATTRNAANEALLRDAGADHVIVDKDGNILPAVQAIYADGVDKLLELVGTVTVPNSLRCLAEDGVCCSAGTLGGKWTMDNFVPNMALPLRRYLTGYGVFTFSKANTPWDELLPLVESGEVKVKVGKVFQGLEGVVEAHEIMERDEAGGKIVVVV